MKFYIHIIAALHILVSISLSPQNKEPSNDLDSLKLHLMDVDRQFSKLSEIEGINKAFLFYAAEDAVLLRPNTPPVIGRKMMKENYFSESDLDYTLTWEPLYADVALSGELGYTFGIYGLKTKADAENQIIKNGTYVSIWKKDQLGNWKFVLDTGNERLEPNNK